MKLSILIPGVPSRLARGAKLMECLQRQAEALNRAKDVEIIWLIDNFAKTIGGKRNSLIDLASGEYVTMIDDDDRVTDNYLAKILEALDKGPDLVTFNQDCTWNEAQGIIEFRLWNNNEEFHPGGVTKRPPWHLNVWKREKVAHIRFPELNWAEDGAWSKIAKHHVHSEIHIPEVLYIYNHQDLDSESTKRMNREKILSNPENVPQG